MSKTNYRDLDPNFIAHPISGDVGVLTDEAAVKQSIKNLILTNYYEKFYSPRYGGNANHYLFRKLNNLEKAVIESNILETIALYEPRVTDVSLTVDLDYQAQAVIINLYFTIISIEFPVSLNVTLTRIR